MKGLVIWAQSNCRSMMGLFSELIKIIDCPVVVALWKHPKDGCDNLRDKVGFSSDEFAHITMLPVGESWEAGKKILDEHPGYAHIFTIYQSYPNYRRLIVEAKRRGEHVGIMGEAPCNMSDGLKGVLKDRVYLPIVVPIKIRKVIKSCDFIMNLNGDDPTSLLKIGWPKDKIIPFGYFSPPIPGSKCVARTTNSDFHILVTGIMTWHRAPDVVMQALVLLKEWGVKCRATFTQKGPLLERLKMVAAKHDLAVEFPGFLGMTELIKLYETCTVYIGAGRSEPWGMRLNDAVQCGAPIVVSRGMGGVKLVDDYGCGATFRADASAELAHVLRRMIEDRAYYLRCAENAFQTAERISPKQMAKEVKRVLQKYFV